MSHLSTRTVCDIQNHIFPGKTVAMEEFVVRYYDIAMHFSISFGFLYEIMHNAGGTRNSFLIWLTLSSYIVFPPLKLFYVKCYFAFSNFT